MNADFYAEQTPLPKIFVLYMMCHNEGKSHKEYLKISKAYAFSNESGRYSVILKTESLTFNQQF